MNIFIIITIVIVCLIAIVLGLAFGLKKKKETPTFSCDKNTGQCVEDSSSKLLLGDCEKQCAAHIPPTSMVTCEPTTGNCVPDKDGTMTKTDCDKSCTITPGPVPPTDPCLHKNCGDHGTCEHGKCICDHGWTGDSCQTPTGPPGPIQPGKFPDIINGYYLWAWQRNTPDCEPAKGFNGANVGITFAGAAVDSDDGGWLNVAMGGLLGFVNGWTKGAKTPQTSNSVNLVSIGGPNANKFTEKNLNYYDTKVLDDIIKAKYDGVCFDLESIDNPNTLTVDRFKQSFLKTKQRGLLVMVTTSWFNGYMIDAKWMNDFITELGTNPEYVDLLSPQLYTANCDTDDKKPIPHPWDGKYAWSPGNTNNLSDDARDAYQNAKNMIVPSINDDPKNIQALQKIWTQTLKRNWQGYIQFCNNYYGGDTQGCPS
jgi:hypothetical protein